MSNQVKVKKVNPTRIILKGVRISYCSLWTPKASRDDEGNDLQDKDGNTIKKYGCQLIISKTDKFAKENEKNLNDAIKAAKEKGKSKLVNKSGKMVNLKICKRDGDTDETYEGEEIYKNSWVVNCSNMQKPQIIDKNRQPILDGEEVYSGIFAHVSITLNAFDSGKSKGIAAYVNSLMKIKDGDRLDGQISAEVEFSEIEVDDDEDDEAF